MIRLTRLCAATCVAAFAISINAQIPTGSVDGIAKDAGGARVRGVQVTATSESQGAMREGQSNADGSFTLPNLAPGAYTIVLTSTGFGEVRYPHVQIQAGKATTLDTVLRAAASTSVDVASAGQQVDLTQSMLQGQIISTTIASIPLNGRNFLELAFLIPGNRPAANFDPTNALAATSSASSPIPCQESLTA